MTAQSDNMKTTAMMNSKQLYQLQTLTQPLMVLLQEQSFLRTFPCKEEGVEGPNQISWRVGGVTAYVMTDKQMTWDDWATIIKGS